MWAQHYSTSLIPSICLLNCAESSLMNEMWIGKSIFIQDSSVLCVRDRERSRCTPFWFPEPHLRDGFLWWKWQSVSSLQKLHTRCFIWICKFQLFNFFNFSARQCYSKYMYAINIIYVKIGVLSLSCCALIVSGVVAQQSEIWFLDRSLCWHLMTSTFTSYYRLMITHLGLPEWQYAFTPYGPSPQAKVLNPSF